MGLEKQQQGLQLYLAFPSIYNVDCITNRPNCYCTCNGSQTKHFVLLIEGLSFPFFV